jgi:Family of unknown function (DUF6011)
MQTYPAAFQAFEAANPEIAEWWNNTTFDFALSLRDQVLRGRVLSDRQFAAARSCIAKVKAARAASAAREADAANVDVSAMETMLANGKRTLLNPKVRLLGANGQTFVFSLAPAYGKNAGAIYVKNGDQYLGKIAGGKFLPVGSCPYEDEADVIKACQAPEASAVAYGQKFGICSCCGRTLTNPESIELGIGPICRENFFG